MTRDFGKEIDNLQQELSKLEEKLSAYTQSANKQSTAKKKKTAKSTSEAKAEIDMHEKLNELCIEKNDRNVSGMVVYHGVFSSSGRQSKWISKTDTDELLSLIENRTAEKVLNCIGNADRLNILLAILKKPMSVAELVIECNLSSTGQAYHHMKPLLAVDLIAEDDENNNKGKYIVQPHKVQGIIMLLAGISDMVDETYTKGSWKDI